jgi:hypothetical protein
MAKLFFESNQSLDGYLDHQKFAPAQSESRRGLHRMPTVLSHSRRRFTVIVIWKIP